MFFGELETLNFTLYPSRTVNSFYLLIFHERMTMIIVTHVHAVIHLLP